MKTSKRRASRKLRKQIERAFANAKGPMVVMKEGANGGPPVPVYLWMVKFPVGGWGVFTTPRPFPRWEELIEELIRRLSGGQTVGAFATRHTTECDILGGPCICQPTFKDVSPN